MNGKISCRTNRTAVTLIEVLVVFAIISILLALLLPAIQQARHTARRIEAANGIRQSLVATHHYAADHEFLPDVDGNPYSRGIQVSAILALLPYLEGNSEHPPKLMRFPSDPSLALTGLVGPGVDPIHDPQLAVTSLAINPWVYSKGMRLSSSISDGTSSTLAITEHYGICNTANFQRDVISVECYDSNFKRMPLCESKSHGRATFADGKMFQDVVPITTNGPNGSVTRGSLPLTFQVRPPLDQCDPRIPQSSFPGGVLGGFADGSVRFIRAGVNEAAFWSSVTPDKGEILTLD